jgi:pimeloyl-ACP methyl ester carboxylesterase
VRRVILIADGAGDFRKFSESMRATARADGLPLEAATFVWSHGYRRQLADQTHTAHACRKGEEMAAQVLAILHRDPATQVSLAGHSGGALVALVAARRLPADSLHAVILLAPSVSEDYEVRPVLRACRAGLHNFYSRRDRIALGVVTKLLGMSDERFEDRAAGRFGFRAPPHGPGDPLWRRLFQYPWQPDYARLGHDGGHFGGYAPDFMRAFLFPVLLGRD